MTASIFLRYWLHAFFVRTWFKKHLGSDLQTFWEHPKNILRLRHYASNRNWLNKRERKKKIIVFTSIKSFYNNSISKCKSKKQKKKIDPNCEDINKRISKSVAIQTYLETMSLDVRKTRTQIRLSVPKLLYIFSLSKTLDVFIKRLRFIPLKDLFRLTRTECLNEIRFK